MALCAESLLVVTGLTIRLLALDGKAVSELEIEIVHFREIHALTAVDRRKARRAEGHHVLPRHAHLDQIRAVMSVCARFLCMAGRTGRR